jgi:polyisoprenoid-binding protein YceI
MNKNLLIKCATCFLLTFTATSNLFAKKMSINTKKSTVYWQGTKVTGQHTGTLKVKSGEYEVTDGVLKSGMITLDMKSLVVTDLSGDTAKKFIEHVNGDDFFKVNAHPEATLKINEVKGLKVNADLTILGKTNPITFIATVDGKNIFGTLEFDRTKFDIKYGTGSLLDIKTLGDKAIADTVTLAFSITGK